MRLIQGAIQGGRSRPPDEEFAGPLRQDLISNRSFLSRRKMALQGFSQQNYYCRLLKHSSSRSLNSFNPEQ